MNFKIQPDRHSGCLCAGCRHSTVQQRRGGDLIVHCSEVSARVPPDIVKCNDFFSRESISQYELEKVAWTLNTDKSGKMIGFSPPKKEK